MSVARAREGPEHVSQAFRLHSLVPRPRPREGKGLVTIRGGAT